jgi:NADP-dependent 3-hydroxy acid dehydrogenase YdfG
VFGTTRGNAEPKRAPEEVELVRVVVRDEESVRSCVGTVLDRAGRIDALVNNAGYTLISSVEETSIEEAKQLFETNVFGVLRMTQAVLPFMRGQRSGRIVTRESQAAATFRNALLIQKRTSDNFDLT